MFLYSDRVTVSWTKVLISGPPGSGKSSSLKLLLEEEPGDNKHRSTPVLQPVLAKKIAKKKWKRINGSMIDEIGSDTHFIRIVDTGGQAAFLDIAPIFWSRRIYAWARTKHFGCHSVCYNGKSLSGHQT